jgi:hypothetical protein
MPSLSRNSPYRSDSKKGYVMMSLLLRRSYINSSRNALTVLSVAFAVWPVIFTIAAETAPIGPWEYEPDADAHFDVIAIDKVIDSVLGPEGDKFGATSFKGISLGCPASEIISETSRDGCQWNVKDKVVQSGPQGNRRCEMMVYADKSTDKVVAIAAKYDAPLQAMAEDIKEVFGTPSVEMTEWSQPGPNNTRLDGVFVRYSFPQTVVVVRSFFGQTWIVVVDKNYLLSDLRRCAHAVATSAQWMKSTINANAGNTQKRPVVRNIADTILDESSTNTLVLCVDKSLKVRMDADGRNRKRFETAEDPRTCDVAGAACFPDEVACVALADPLVSPSVGLHLLKGRGISNGGLEFTLCDTPLHQLFWDTASTLMQLQFPPSTDNITIQRPGYFIESRSASNDGDYQSAPAASRWFSFAVRNAGPRHEWIDQDREVVCVGANLMLSLRHNGKKSGGL